VAGEIPLSNVYIGQMHLKAHFQTVPGFALKHSMLTNFPEIANLLEVEIYQSDPHPQREPEELKFLERFGGHYR
jgi:hypothetical protein